VELTHYTFEAGGVEACQVLCAETMQAKEVDKIRDLIDKGYRVRFLLDNLPVVMRSIEFDYIVRGYPLGFKASGDVWGGEGDEVRAGQGRAGAAKQYTAVLHN